MAYATAEIYRSSGGPTPAESIVTLTMSHEEARYLLWFLDKHNFAQPDGPVMAALRTVLA
jgi:hypothetical protein